MIRPDKNQYPLSQGFNDPCCRQIYKDAFGWVGHNGLDIAIPCGKPLYASHTGKVYAFVGPGYGKAVFITGNGYESVAGHMSRIDVSTGQTVKEGQMIGLSGNEGFSSGCHCHFGVRPIPYNRGNGFEGYINPEPLLKGGAEMITSKGQLRRLWLQFVGKEPAAKDYAGYIGKRTYSYTVDKLSSARKDLPSVLAENANLKKQLEDC